jgi:nucleoside-diphosphate kinase
LKLGDFPEFLLVEEILERTLIIVKPDGVQRGLIGEVIKRLESRGLRMVAAKFVQIEPSFAQQHYAVHEGKPFYKSLIEYITSAPVMAMVWEGSHAIRAARQTMGATNPVEAAPGSIRHDFGQDIGRNITHASDAVDTAQTEIALWFTEPELVDWKRDIDPWIFE